MAVTRQVPALVMVRDPVALLIAQPAPVTLKLSPPIPKPAETLTRIALPTVPVNGELVMVIDWAKRGAALKVKVAVVIAAL